MIDHGGLKMIMTVVLLFASGFYSKYAVAQRPLLRHFTTQDGLPSNVIYDCFQDTKGFIWFGTDQGISRFDGHEFKNYSIKDGLPDNEVLYFMEDRQQRCWLVSYNYKPCYLQNGKVFNSTNDKLCRQLEQVGMGYSYVYLNKDGELCFAGQKLVILKKGDVLQQVQDMGFSFPRFYASYAGREYMLTNIGLFQFANGQKRPVVTGHLIDALRVQDDLYIIGRTDKELLIHCVIDSSGIKIMDSVRTPFRMQKTYSLSPNELLCCAHNGVWLFNTKTKTFTVGRDAPQHMIINRMLKDHECNTWFTSLQNGVYMHLNAGPEIYDKQSGLHSDNIISINVDRKGPLLVGTEPGVLDIVEPGSIQKSTNTSRLQLQNRIRSAFCLNGNEYIIATDYGLFRNRIHPPSREIEEDICIKDCKMMNGYSLVASPFSALRYDIATHKIHKLYTGYVTTIAEDHQKMIWLGTRDGLYRGKDTIYTKLTIDTVLPHSRILSLGVTPQDRLVIGTGRSGIFILSGDTLVHLQDQNGLSSNNCKKVVVDRYGTIWTSTDNGLDRIDLKEFPSCDIYNYSLADGVFSNKINDIDVDDNHIYMATADGLVLLKKHKERATIQPPSVFITSVNESECLFADNGRQFESPYDHNELIVSYTAVSFLDGKNITYKYFLEGAGKNDTIITPVNTINFSWLNSGAYRLYIWARGKKTAWSPQPAVLRFRILPPFWETWWFRLLLLLFVIGIAYVAYRRHLRHVRHNAIKDVSRKRQLAELEMQALRAQINPHFIFNALNAIQHYYSQNDELTANHYMTSFAQFMRQTLAYSSAHWLSLEEETAMLNRYIELEQMRFNDIFDYEIIIFPDIAMHEVNVPAMLIQPYVENAIIHGLAPLERSSGYLQIRFEVIRDILICIIDDNGIGILQSQQNKQVGHKSLGMDINHGRIEAINQLYDTSIQIKVVDKKTLDSTTHGTQVTISIPLKIDRIC